MQLKLTTDYAIRTIVYLATQSGITSVAEIGSKMGISENYLMKVLKALKDAGLVAGYQGKRGGYAISKKPEEISLWDIVEVMEGTTKVNRCLEKDGFCSRHGTQFCMIRRYYQELQDQIEDYLTGITIDKVLEKRQRVDMPL